MTTSNGSKGYSYLAAAIVVAAALVSTSLLVAPMESSKTSTVTAESTVSTTVTLPASTITDMRNVTTIILSTTTVTVTTTPPVCVAPVCQVTTPLCSTSVVAADAKANAPAPSPTTVAPSGEADATNSSSERKTLSAAGRTWVFYTDGCNVLYQSSADGATWSSPTVARGGIERGWFFTVAQNGTTVYMVVSASDGSTGGKITYRYGTMLSNGTIAWSISEEDLPYNGSAATVPTVALDSSGNVWIAIEDFSGAGATPGTAPGGSAGDREIHVFRSAGPGAWSDVFDIGGLTDYPRPILLPLTQGKMALEVLTETPGYRMVSLYTTTNGATWTPPVTTPSDDVLTLSAVAVGDTVYSVTTDTSSNVFFWTFPYGASSFSGPTPLATCCSGSYNDAVISTDGASSLLVAYSNSNDVVVQTSSDLGSSWSLPTTLATAESSIQPGSLATAYLGSGTAPIFWTAASTSTSSAAEFSIRYASASY